MHVVHLMASPFVGGPERQVLGLARAMRPHRSTFLSFAERGLARPFLEKARADGFEAIELQANFPRIGACIDEVARLLKRLKADALLASCYKPDLIGWRAARKAGVPVVAIAHGWTGATLKVRFYEFLDAVAMRFMDAVACVSESMARRVRRAGVPGSKVEVIRNALDFAPFESLDAAARPSVLSFFKAP
ncbi:MAG: glycosyltransferase, partial [Gemmataceae bacterium]|nr:glycosyltransferase [Gemmataceae bacterium]